MVFKSACERNYRIVLSAITDTYTFVRNSMMGDICIILGTRPEIIKMSPVARACERQGSDWFVLHTGQHYLWDGQGVL